MQQFRNQEEMQIERANAQQLHLRWHSRDKLLLGDFPFHCPLISWWSGQLDAPSLFWQVFCLSWWFSLARWCPWAFVYLTDCVTVSIVFLFLVFSSFGGEAIAHVFIRACFFIFSRWSVLLSVLPIENRKHVKRAGMDTCVKRVWGSCPYISWILLSQWMCPSQQSRAAKTLLNFFDRNWACSYALSCFY